MLKRRSSDIHARKLIELNLWIPLEFPLHVIIYSLLKAKWDEVNRLFSVLSNLHLNFFVLLYIICLVAVSSAFEVCDFMQTSWRVSEKPGIIRPRLESPKGISGFGFNLWSKIFLPVLLPPPCVCVWELHNQLIVSCCLLTKGGLIQQISATEALTASLHLMDNCRKIKNSRCFSCFCL